MDLSYLKPGSCFHILSSLDTPSGLTLGSGYSLSSFSGSFMILCDSMDCSTPGFPVYHQFLELAQTHDLPVDLSSNHLILCCPLLLLPLIFPRIRVFSNESVLHNRWPNSKVGVSASASVLPMNSQD